MSTDTSCEDANGRVGESYADSPVEECSPRAAANRILSNSHELPSGTKNEVVIIKNEEALNNNAMAIDGECNMRDKPNDFLLKSLDAIELRVEKMRETARSVEEEKTTLLKSLSTMMQSEAIDHLSEAEREELGMFIDRLITRCLTVEINIQTVRTAAQEQSLCKVRSLLRELVDTFIADLERSRQRLQLYLNSCLDSAEAGPIDERFQGAVLGCAAEDQKAVKRKLQELKDAFGQSEGLVEKLRQWNLDL